MFPSLLLTAGLFVGTENAAMEAAHLATFTSYTKAWSAAKESSRPMFVVLNPSEGGSKGKTRVDLRGLRKDEKLNKLLDDFVVAEIDTGTTHGRKVHQKFGSPALPRIVVIDDHQAKQVFAVSGVVSPTSLKTRLAKLTIKAAIKNLSLDWLPKSQANASPKRLKSVLNF
jgi:hypothetical protein